MLIKEHKLLTIQALNNKTLEYVASKQRKLRTSINKPYNVIVIMFELVGASFISNMNSSFERNCHKVYHNYSTLCHLIGQVRTQNILTHVAKTSYLYCWPVQNAFTLFPIHASTPLLVVPCSAQHDWFTLQFISSHAVLYPS